MGQQQASALESKISAYKQMVDVNPNDPHYLRRYAELLLQADRKKEGAQQLRKLEKLYQRQGMLTDAVAIRSLRLTVAPESAGPEETAAPFLYQLDPKALNHLIRNAKQIELGEGEHLFRQNDADDRVFIVLEGELAVLVHYRHSPDPTLVHLLQEGEIVGEIAFLDGRPRTASVVANKPSRVLQLSHKRILQCLLKHPEVGDLLRDEGKKRQLLTILNSNPILTRLEASSKLRLISNAQLKKYAPFKVVIKAKSQVKWVGLMVKGLVRIVAEDSSGRSHLLEPVFPGDLLGEASALRDEAMLADMVSVDESSVLQIPIEDFHAVMEENPLVKARIIEHAADKIAYTMTMISNRTNGD